MSKAARLSMCPHCGALFPATASTSTPAHWAGQPLAPPQAKPPGWPEFPTLCPGAFDTARNPWHDRRKLYNGEDPPTQEQVAAFAERNRAKK